jgi:hypothetical protein
VDRALAFEQSERWPSARMMQTALWAVQAEVELQPGRIPQTGEDSGAIRVVGNVVGLPEASLEPGAMRMASTRSRYVPPMESVSDTSVTLPKRALGRRRRVSDRSRRGILAGGAAAMALAFVGRTGHAPPTPTDAPFASTPISTPQHAQAVDPNTSAIAEAQDPESEAPVPSLAASTPSTTRGAGQHTTQAGFGKRKRQNALRELARPDRPPPPETDLLGRRK